MSTADKIATLFQSTIANDLELYAVPGEQSIIDTIHPVTGLTRINGNTEAEIRARAPLAVRMTWAAWTDAASARQRTPITWSPTTRAQYWEMLEVLLPIAWRDGAFLVGEPTDHDVLTGEPRYAAYRQIGPDDDTARYLVASRPLTRRELRAELQQQ